MILLIFLFILGSYFNAATISTSYAHRTYSTSNADYANFNCPPNAGSLLSCYADNVTTVSNYSMGYGGILVISCIYGMCANNYNVLLLVSGGIFSSSSVASPLLFPTISATVSFSEFTFNCCYYCIIFLCSTSQFSATTSVYV